LTIRPLSKSRTAVFASLQQGFASGESDPGI
jgi:hypothetical protein